MADLLRQLNEETPTRRVAQWAGVPVPPLLDRETIAPPREEPLKDQLVALHTSRDSGSGQHARGYRRQCGCNDSYQW